MLRIFLPLALCAAALPAAVIRGTVADIYTGSALARAVVTLQPIGSPDSAVVTVRTNDSGSFEFPKLAAGAYIVKAARRGFLPLEYGQRQWNSSGTPIVLAADAVAFLNIGLHRYGSIGGTVRDENEIGLPGEEVIAYRDTEPPELVTRATTDDRGVFRIPGLAPGNYRIRTMGSDDSGIAYFPTFSRQTLRVEDARQVPVYLDEETKDVDVHPLPGTLLSLSGNATGVPDGWDIALTLVSDIGRRTVTSAAFRFGALPPGAYEIYAVAREPAPGTGVLGGYDQFTLARSLNSYVLAMTDVRETQFDFGGGITGGGGRRGRGQAPAVPASDAPTILARRKDLAGVGASETLELVDNRALIPPGRWELLAMPPSGYYVASFSPSRNSHSRPDTWNEIVAGSGYNRVRILQSGGASTLHGIVKFAGEVAGGAPVFLETWDPNLRTRLADLRSTRADMRGNYRFEGLAPGAYRIVSTYEYLAPDTAAMDLLGAKAIVIEGHSDLQTDVTLYGIP